MTIITLLLMLTTTVVATKSFGTTYITSANQYYTVFFDEEGEAYVALRLDIFNKDTQPIEFLNLEIPGDHMIIYKIIQEHSYGYEEIQAKPTRLADSVYLTLDIMPIVKGQKSTFLVFYKVEGYVDSFLKKHDFEFETIRIPYLTNDIKVTIDVQEGLELKGKDSKVNYMPDFNMLNKGAALEAAEFRKMSDVMIRDYGYTKNANMLDPYESFSVTGTYAKNWFYIHLNLIMGIAFGLIGFIAILMFILFVKLIVK